MHWIFSAASFAFATVTSGALSTDCLQSGTINAAVQRVLLHLAVPVTVLLLLMAIQIWPSKFKLYGMYLSFHMFCVLVFLDVYFDSNNVAVQDRTLLHLAGC